MMIQSVLHNGLRKVLKCTSHYSIPILKMQASRAKILSLYAVCSRQRVSEDAKLGRGEGEDHKKRGGHEKRRNCQL